MPIEPRQDESRDEFTSRCISKEIESGKSQDQAIAICITKADEAFVGETASVSDATWSTEAPINVNLKSYLAREKVSFDYDETLTTRRGMELAKRLIDQGADVYVISARGSENAMWSRTDELGIPRSRVIATGSNKAKVEKVKELNISKHYDNNSDVVKELPKIGEKFSAVRKVIFNEDFNEDDVKRYKELGFKIYIRSARKIKKRDKKVWNKLQSVGLTEDAIVFGEVKELDKRHNFDLIMTGDDPLLEMLLTRGKPHDAKNVIYEEWVESLEDAKTKAELALKNIDLKFIRVVSVYTYEEMPGVAPAVSGSRPFCKRMIDNRREYTYEEIQDISNKHLVEQFSKYGIEPDVFLYRGGWYRIPETTESRPFCRHQWKLKVKVER